MIKVYRGYTTYSIVTEYPVFDTISDLHRFFDPRARLRNVRGSIAALVISLDSVIGHAAHCLIGTVLYNEFYVFIRDEPHRFVPLRDYLEGVPGFYASFYSFRRRYTQESELYRTYERILTESPRLNPVVFQLRLLSYDEEQKLC